MGALQKQGFALHITMKDIWQKQFTLRVFSGCNILGTLVMSTSKQNSFKKDSPIL